MTKYLLTNQRLMMHSGVLSKKIGEVELYRVKDTRMEQPFFLRLFKLGNVVLTTSDVSAPSVVLKALPNAQELREQFRKLVEVRRDQKDVREMDVR